MGEVGGNGSVVWQNQHHAKKGKFKCKGRGKLKPDELGLGDDDLDVWGHDDIPFEDIGKDPAPGLEPGLEGFQRRGYFLVRLRFDEAEADAISKWFETIGRNLPPTVIRLIRVGRTIILAINVKALHRDEPDDGISWENPPFEIRYDW
jgi:hypothetical protein